MPVCDYHKWLFVDYRCLEVSAARQSSSHSGVALPEMSEVGGGIQLRGGVRRRLVTWGMRRSILNLKNPYCAWEIL